MSPRSAPKPIRILDLFLLQLVSEGCSTLFALQTKAGLSQGATVPAFRRLEAKGYIRRGKAASRRRREILLTRSGIAALKGDRVIGLSQPPPSDLDESLRMAALIFRYRRAELTDFLSRIAARLRSGESQPERPEGGTAAQYRWMRAVCKSSSCRAQADALERIASTVRKT